MISGQRFLRHAMLRLAQVSPAIENLMRMLGSWLWLWLWSEMFANVDFAAEIANTSSRRLLLADGMYWPNTLARKKAVVNHQFQPAFESTRMIPEHFNA
ncbi:MULTISPECIES: hypothetical protein [unclassified Frigoribacterium]|uniref:hypothetical protein n=1 Tax=unclassified Frigoribacterium TaxID=2627005 RepID=UPI0015662FB3|nr:MULTISPECIES: hypothetical protein [unclassified Frigoribacterium]NQW87497.1 hypothetical protein [Frigoribacterium sp. VKM Ac-2860]NQX09694.1 hypothetical protein [Frigoribacterium sp. VKM Ac-2859]